MTKPLVSIIIPVHNAAKYLSGTIGSALGQTYPNKELIIVDDGSTDDSVSIAKQFEAPGTRIYAQPNKGASAARNAGIREARGKYLQFLDADDLLSPDKISSQVNALERSPGKIAICSIAKFEDGSDHARSVPSPRDEPFIYSTEDVVDFLVDLYGGYRVRGSMIGIHSWLVPAEIIEKTGPWNEQLTVDDDGEYFCRVVLSAAGIISTNGVSYYRVFRTNKENLSARTDHHSLQSMIDSFRLKKGYLLSRTDKSAAHFALYKQALNLAIKTYMVDASLYKEMDHELRSFPYYDYKPIIGGKFLNFITTAFGWRTARFLQYYYTKV